MLVSKKRGGDEKDVLCILKALNMYTGEAKVAKSKQKTNEEKLNRRKHFFPHIHIVSLKIFPEKKRNKKAKREIKSKVSI